MTNGCVDVILGSQWGDEGKGKLADILCKKYDVVVRVAGGANAGHTIVCNGKTFKLHLLPSGILHSHTTNVLGHGVVLDLPVFIEELQYVEEITKVDDYKSRIYISDRTHLVFQHHKYIDGLYEGERKNEKIGTTKRGIGPCYASKAIRNGIRTGDLMGDFEIFKKLYKEQVAFYMKQYPELLEKIDTEKELLWYEDIRQQLKFCVVDTTYYLEDSYKNGKRILVEGANGTMLDVDFGTYPYVTSSNPSIGSVCTGGGISPKKINDIIAIVKAYCTRVGEGPFPTELLAKDGEEKDLIREFLIKKGKEYGTTTGRQRRVGWLDLFALKYSQIINEFTYINLTKLDILSGLETLYLGVEYRYKGKTLTSVPSTNIVWEEVEVKYEKMDGWTQDLQGCSSFEGLPLSAQKYINYIEEFIGVPIKWIGVGPQDTDMIVRDGKKQ